MTVEVEHPAWGGIRQVGLPFELSATPAEIRTAAAAARRDTRRDPGRARLRRGRDRGPPRARRGLGRRLAERGLRAPGAGTTSPTGRAATAISSDRSPATGARTSPASTGAPAPGPAPAPRARPAGTADRRDRGDRSTGRGRRRSRSRPRPRSSPVTVLPRNVIAAQAHEAEPGQQPRTPSQPATGGGSNRIAV